MNVLTLPDGQNSIELMPSNGSSAVLLLAEPVSASGGVDSVGSTSESGILVDNTDPANPLIFNEGVLDLVVEPPLVLLGSGQHPDIGIDTTKLGGTPATSNKNMPASVTTADGQLACAAAMANTPASSSSVVGGYVGVGIASGGGGSLLLNVGDGTKVGVDCYFSADGGATPRAMKAIAAGDLLYWNGSVAGYQLAATDRLSFFYSVAA